MTSPLSPEAVAQMVADREAGTPGPWRMRVNKRDDQDTCDVSICGDIFVLADLNGPQYAHQRANARRIARLPDLEAAYLSLVAQNATLRAELREDAMQYLASVGQAMDRADEARASEAAALERVAELLTIIDRGRQDHLSVDDCLDIEYARALTPTADKEPKT